MKLIARRLSKLESSSHFEPPPTACQQIKSLALAQAPDEDLQLMMIMASDAAAGIDRPVSQLELEVLKAHDARREAEALRMGFRSFADAELRGRLVSHLVPWPVDEALKHRSLMRGYSKPPTPPYRRWST